MTESFKDYFDKVSQLIAEHQEETRRIMAKATGGYHPYEICPNCQHWIHCKLEVLGLKWFCRGCRRWKQHWEKIFAND